MSEQGFSDDRSMVAAIRIAEDLDIMDQAEVLASRDAAGLALLKFAHEMMSRGMRPTSTLSQLTEIAHAIWFHAVGLTETRAEDGGS